MAILKKKTLGVVLFMGRKKCPYSKKIKDLLKKKSKKLYYFEEDDLINSLKYQFFYHNNVF